VNGRLDELAAVRKIDLDGAPDLLPALRFDLGIEHTLHFAHQRLHGRALHELVVELVDTGFAPQRDRADHERGAELGLELVRGNRIAQRVQDVGARTHADRRDLTWLHVVLQHEAAHGVHRRMAQHAARIRLDRHAGRHDRVRLTQQRNDARGIVALTVAEGLEEAPRRVEGVLAAREAARGELRGDDAVLRRAAYVQRLRHAAEAHANTRGRARGDRKHVRRLCRIQSEQLRGGDGRAERADGAGRVEAFLVMIRVDRLGDLALDLEAGQERLENLLAGNPLRLADGERSHQRRHRRVRQQAEDAVRARR
jgi:hypothetical protein